jgi:hypothetical protein
MSAVPVYMGCKLDHAIQSQSLGGRLLADVFASKVTMTGRDDSAVQSAIREVCFVALNFKEEMRSEGLAPVAPAAGQPYRGWKASGQGKQVAVGNIKVGAERFCVPELLFSPGLHANTENMVPTPVLAQGGFVLLPSFLACSPHGHSGGCVLSQGDARALAGQRCGEW